MFRTRPIIAQVRLGVKHPCYRQVLLCRFCLLRSIHVLVRIAGILAAVSTPDSSEIGRQQNRLLQAEQQPIEMLLKRTLRAA